MLLIIRVGTNNGKNAPEEEGARTLTIFFLEQAITTDVFAKTGDRKCNKD